MQTLEMIELHLKQIKTKATGGSLCIQWGSSGQLTRPGLGLNNEEGSFTVSIYKRSPVSLRCGSPCPQPRGCPISFSAKQVASDAPGDT